MSLIPRYKIISFRTEPGGKKKRKLDLNPPENSAGRRYDDRASVREIYVLRERNLHILAGIHVAGTITASSGQTRQITVQPGRAACREKQFF